jgi:hypothetical protein
MFTVHQAPKHPLYCYVATIYMGSWPTEMWSFSITTLLSYITGHLDNVHLVITHQSEPDNVLLYC